MAKSKIAGMTLSMDTRKFAGQQTTRLMGRLAFQMNQTRKAPDANAVHDLRVAIRRFTQALGVFKPCFHGKDTRKIRRRLKKLMAVAGEVRDSDVTLKLLSKSRAAAAAGLQSKLHSERKTSERVLVSMLKRRIERKSSLKWRAALESTLAANGEALHQVPLEEAARQVLPDIARDFLERGDAAAHPAATPKKLHAFRIACKKFRYTLELFVPLYGASLNGWLDPIKRMQKLLGEINDCATAAEMVSRYRGTGTLARWLKRRQRKRAEVFTQEWREQFGDRPARESRIRDLVRISESPRAVRKPPTASGTTARAANRGTGAVA